MRRVQWSGLWAMPMLAFLTLPVIALVGATTTHDFTRGFSHPSFIDALVLSLESSLMSLGLLIVFGTPLAWWMARATGPWTVLARSLVDLPLVLPPAVLGLGLLMAFGREGLLGHWLSTLGVSVPFTKTAVIIAQSIVGAPLYVQSASSAFARVSPDLIWVARSLGFPPTLAFLKVTVPVALPGVTTGLLLAWARGVGEFGATLLFAGNLPRTTQTMPLAIYTALESDIQLALSLSLILVAAALGVLLLLRFIQPQPAKSGGEYS